MTDLERQLLESVLDVVNQACQVEYAHGEKGMAGKCIVNPLATGAYEDAIDMLQELGYAKPLGNDRWELVWPEQGA